MRMLLESKGDCLAEGGAGICESYTMADAKPRGALVAELGCALRGECGVPAEKSGKWERVLEHTCYQEAVLRCKRVAAEKGIIAGIEKREMARSVARGGDGEEQADAIAVVESGGGFGFDTHEAEERLAVLVPIERKIPGQQTRFARADGDFDVGKLASQRVERADMIEMSVSEEDALDREIQFLYGSENGIRGAEKVRVDEGGSAAVFDEKTVDQAKAREAVDVFGFLSDFQLAGAGLSAAALQIRAIFSRWPLLSATTSSAEILWPAWSGSMSLAPRTA